MKFRLQFRRWATIIVAVLTVAMAFFLVKPVSANNAVTPTTVTQPTNQPNAPNLSVQATSQSSELTGNSQQTNQSTSTMASDEANANKSATTAAKSTENNLSSDKQNGQSQQADVSGSNNSKALNSQAEQVSQPTNSQEITPADFTAKFVDASGNEIPADGQHQIDQYTPLDIRFEFHTGQNVHSGDYFGFTIANPGDRLTIQQTSIPLNNADGQNIGVAELESVGNQINGRVMFTVTGAEADGQFDVQLAVDTNKANSGDNIPVTVTLPNDHQITANFHYVPGSDDPKEEFSKYSYNDTLGPDKSNPNDTDPNYYTPDDITKGNLTYALRLIHHNGDAEYTQAEITDELQTPGFIYDRNSFLLYRTHWTYTNGQWQAGKLTNVSDYQLNISDNGQSFTMDFSSPTTLGDGDGYVVFYRLLYGVYDDKGNLTYVPVNKIKNTADKPGNGTIIHNVAKLDRPNTSTITYPQTMVIKGSDGTAQVRYYSITVTKTDKVTGRVLPGATFELLQNGKVIQSQTTDANGNATFSNLLRGNYTLHESSAPANYRVADDVQVTSGNFSNYAYAVTIADVPMTTTSVTVTKIWKDNNDQAGKRPDSIIIRLYNGDKEVDHHTIRPDNKMVNPWTYTFANLPKYDAQGKEIVYTVREDTVANYTKSTSGYQITNTYVPPVTPTISKTVTKIWNDANNQDRLRPGSIKVNLLANGQIVRTVTLTAADNWTATINGLAQKANGQNIDYTWQEADVPTGYTSDVNGDVITNTHTPATISKTVTKQWVDNDNQDGLRPGSITVNLLANGQIVKTVELTAANNWTATIDGLAQKANGQDIAYTWQEANVPAGYESKVDGDVITNTHAPLTTKVTVTKVWNDADNQDGLRPASVTINLLANGQVIRTVELNATNNWRAEFDDLMVYSHQGQRIVYTVEEANVPAGYQSAVSQDGLNFTVTNTHQPTKPTEPTTPDQPTTPATPEQPSQPTTPTEPTTPVTPGQPVQPGTPVAPGQPNVPAQSVQPSQTVSQGQSQLPQTGNHDGLALMVLGLVLLSMTIYVGKQRD